MELAKALRGTPELLETLVVITNSLAVATVFESGRLCRKLFLLGGWVSADQYSSHSSQTAAMLRDFHVNKSFISGVALSEDYILTGYYDEDVIFQKAAIQAASQTILMLDHSKFKKTAVLSVAHLSELDFLVSDKQLSEKESGDLAGFGVEFVQA